MAPLGTQASEATSRRGSARNASVTDSKKVRNQDHFISYVDVYVRNTYVVVFCLRVSTIKSVSQVIVV